MAEKLLTAQEAAKRLGCSLTLLAVWRYRKTGPAYHKLGPGRTAAVRYAEKDLNLFIENSHITTRVAA